MFDLVALGLFFATLIVVLLVGIRHTRPLPHLIVIIACIVGIFACIRSMGIPVRKDPLERTNVVETDRMELPIETADPPVVVRWGRWDKWGPVPPGVHVFDIRIRLTVDEDGELETLAVGGEAEPHGLHSIISTILDNQYRNPLGDKTTRFKERD